MLYRIFEINQLTGVSNKHHGRIFERDIYRRFRRLERKRVNTTLPTKNQIWDEVYSSCKSISQSFSSYSSSSLPSC